MTTDLPPEQTNEAAWYGPAMAARGDWLMPLSAEDIPEIGAAADAQIGSDIARITAKDFPLPDLAPRLKARVRDEVLNGRGFLLLRGLPVESWGLRKSAVAYFGLGAHLGSARSQNGKGH